MEIGTWLSFCFVALLATATPGPAVLLVLVHSLSFGFKMSLATILGNITALFIMSAVSVIGLTALVMHSAFAFSLVKVIGAVYLMYIGVRLWITGIKGLGSTERTNVQHSVSSLYSQGLLVALTNPKAIIFTTALFPQFISVEEALIPQFLILVVTFMALSLTCLALYSLFVHKAKVKINKQVSGEFLGKLFGGVFVGAGCYLASTSR